MQKSKQELIDEIKHILDNYDFDYSKISAIADMMISEVDNNCRLWQAKNNKHIHTCRICLKSESCQGALCDFREEFNAHGECIRKEDLGLV